MSNEPTQTVYDIGNIDFGETTNVYPDAIKIAGSLRAGILLSYLFDKANSNNFEGFYLTDNEIIEIFKFGRDALTRAKRMVIETGVVSIKKEVRKASFYKFNKAEFVRQLSLIQGGNNE